MKKYHKSTNNAITFPENLNQSLTSLLQNPTIHATRLLAVNLAEALLQAEADAICGPRYKNNPHRQLYRWGSQPGYVCVAAVKMPITRPRVRTKNGREVQLQTYRMLQNRQALCEETLTLHRLGVRGELRRSLRTTNTVESCLSLGEGVCERVSRWRDVGQVMRWCGLWLMEAERRMRKVRGRRGLAELEERLRREVASPSIFNYTQDTLGSDEHK